MVISIQPAVIGIILIVTCNCIISFGKSKFLDLCHIILTSVFSIIGIAGMIIFRIIFVERLNRNAITRSFGSDFVSWAITKFDLFAVVSIVITVVVILFCLLNLFLSKNRTGFIWTNTAIFIISIMIVIFMAGIFYGLGTINVLYDIAGYTSQLAIFEIFALHTPFAVKRILMRKNEQCRT